MSAGDSAWNSGLKPLNSTVRSSAGEVWATGIVSPSGSARRVADLLGQRDVALADEVAVADRRVGRLGERGRRPATENVTSARVRSTISTSLTDADLDAGDPDVVALDHAGRVDELGLVGRAAAEGDVADRDDQHAGRHRRDDDEDRAAWSRSHARCCLSTSDGFIAATPPPRAPSGPTSRTPRSGTSSAVTPRAGRAGTRAGPTPARRAGEAAPVRTLRAGARSRRPARCPCRSARRRRR